MISEALVHSQEGVPGQQGESGILQQFPKRGNDGQFQLGKSQQGSVAGEALHSYHNPPTNGPQPTAYSPRPNLGSRYAGSPLMA